MLELDRSINGDQSEGRNEETEEFWSKVVDKFNSGREESKNG